MKLVISNLEVFVRRLALKVGEIGWVSRCDINTSQWSYSNRLKIYQIRQMNVKVNVLN